MLSDREDFFKYYFEFCNIDQQEAPANTHRWTALSIIGTLLGRQIYLPFGHGRLHANQYIQIIGLPASKKSTAIKIGKRILKQYGYTNFAPEKTSLEKFLMDLHSYTWGDEESDSKASTDLEDNLFGCGDPRQRASEMPIAECYIASDEFVDFIGRNNIDFISQLGSFWDFSGVFDRKLKHSTAVYINEPTISIIAGNTPVGFNAAFPPDIQGQGFFSRLLLIHAEVSARKIPFPAAPDVQATTLVLEFMSEIAKCCIGEVRMTSAVRDFVGELYLAWKPLEDKRFEHYTGRRDIHLLKLSMVVAAMRLSTVIDIEDVVLANTILTFAEYSMPKAMGEFGKGKNSGVTQKILEIINASDRPVTMMELLKQTCNDIDNFSVVSQVTQGLIYADKIQVDDGKFLPKRSVRVTHDTKFVMPSLLLPEEQIF
jgi:hypothetical protein